MYLKYEWQYLLPIKPQMAAILDLSLNETLKVTNNFRNEFSIKSHVKMKYYNKIYGKWFRNYNFNMALGGHFVFCQKKDVPLRGNLGTFYR